MTDPRRRRIAIGALVALCGAALLAPTTGAAGPRLACLPVEW